MRSRRLGRYESCCAFLTMQDNIPVWNTPRMR